MPGVASPPAASPGPATPGPRWLGVWFRCCHIYARLYRNAQGTRYTGACPRCGSSVSAKVGPGGTSQRFFEAR
ncbi:MAG TPA: hypothetical protein DEB06_03985 [Phycisphaerales bacterium]|nr:hypothetical protein [Phycisphaerales bacterium]